MSKKKRKKPVRVSARAANLKRRLRRHLKVVGFRKGPDGRLVANGECIRWVEATGLKIIVCRLDSASCGRLLQKHIEGIKALVSPEPI